MDVTKRKEKKRNDIVKVYVCVGICFMDVFFIIIIYDKISKIKEEFNILIGSRSRIINLYESCISNIR